MPPSCLLVCCCRWLVIQLVWIQRHFGQARVPIVATRRPPACPLNHALPKPVFYHLLCVRSFFSAFAAWATPACRWSSSSMECRPHPPRWGRICTWSFSCRSSSSVVLRAARHSGPHSGACHVTDRKELPDAPAGSPVPRLLRSHFCTPYAAHTSLPPSLPLLFFASYSTVPAGGRCCGPCQGPCAGHAAAGEGQAAGA